MEFSLQRLAYTKLELLNQEVDFSLNLIFNVKMNDEREKKLFHFENVNLVLKPVVIFTAICYYFQN